MIWDDVVRCLHDHRGMILVQIHTDFDADSYGCWCRAETRATYETVGRMLVVQGPEDVRNHLWCIFVRILVAGPRARSIFNVAGPRARSIFNVLGPRTRSICYSVGPRTRSILYVFGPRTRSIFNVFGPSARSIFNVVGPREVHVCVKSNKYMREIKGRILFQQKTAL
jgi:hypothetical protein